MPGTVRLVGWNAHALCNRDPAISREPVSAQSFTVGPICIHDSLYLVILVIIYY